MTIFTYSQARRNLAAVLDRAGREGRVLIKRKDGSVFTLCSDTPRSSPLNVRGVKTKVSTNQIVRAVRHSRRHRPR
jgi:hypothetical protein